MRVSDFIEATLSAQNGGEVLGYFEAAVGDLGYKNMCLAAVNTAANKALHQQDHKMALALRCRQDWEKYYLANKYYEVDPVLQHAPIRRTPFLWDDLKKEARLSPQQRLVLEESQDAGMHNGVSIPLHGPAGEAYVISLATDDVHCDNRPLLGHLHILGVQFYLAYATHMRNGQPASDAPRLTNRERECLTWSAHGKSAWAIGHILGVSENTVNFHLKSAMRRLGTTNRVQAVALAVRGGLIHP